MPSFWETDIQTTNDFSIIGGGILGLFTALELSNKFPNTKIAVYERDPFAAGATTKNAGFACFGSISEINVDRKRWGDNKTLDIIQKRWDGIQRIESLLSDKIDYEKIGGYELYIGNRIEKEDLENINHLLFPIFHQNVFRFKQEKIKEFGFGVSVKSLVFNALEGQLHSGKLVRTLHELLKRNHVQIHTNSEVKEFHSGSVVEFVVNNKWIVKTGKLIFCTNAFPPADVHGIAPARGQVLITKPIPNLKLQGCFHFNEGYYYFRNVGNRILFGGGRQLDFDKESTIEFDLNDKIQQDLIEKLHSIISPNKRLEIEQQWSGIMAFSGYCSKKCVKSKNLIFVLK